MDLLSRPDNQPVLWYPFLQYKGGSPVTSSLPHWQIERTVSEKEIQSTENAREYSRGWVILSLSKLFSYSSPLLLYCVSIPKGYLQTFSSKSCQIDYIFLCDPLEFINSLPSWPVSFFRNKMNYYLTLTLPDRRILCIKFEYFSSSVDKSILDIRGRKIVVGELDFLNSGLFPALRILVEVESSLAAI